MKPGTPNDAWLPNQGSWLAVAIAWTLVGIPLAWGIYRTLRTALKIF